jgi:hypothetical protein
MRNLPALVVVCFLTCTVQSQTSSVAIDKHTIPTQPQDILLLMSGYTSNDRTILTVNNNLNGAMDVTLELLT